MGSLGLACSIFDNNEGAGLHPINERIVYSATVYYANSFRDSRNCLRSRNGVGVVASAREKNLH